VASTVWLKQCLLAVLLDDASKCMVQRSWAPQHLTDDRDLVVQKREVDSERRGVRQQRCILHALLLTQRDHRPVRCQRARAWRRGEALMGIGRKCSWGGRRRTYAENATVESE